MGGKTKQSQRTKNNVRPSSSGRSAQLLSNTLGTLPGLTTPGAGKTLPALFPTLAAVNSEQYLDTDFMLCLKKLNKKDPITKTKALQELVELVKSKTVEDVVGVLPFWTRVYRALSIDPEHKVRESAQLAQCEIVSKCGREIGPQLKLLVPAWLQAQYDSFAPAAAAAQKSLSSTFPENKLPEVISFCKAEVIAHLIDNLIGNVEASLQKKDDTPESIEMQYERIVIGSLQGLDYFTQYLIEKHSDWYWTELTPLLDSAKFWKLATHKSGQVRSAWFAALGRLIERYKAQFGSQHGQKTVKILLGAAKERSSVVASQVWTCLLLLMHNVENWHQWLEKKNELSKRIVDIVENGGWGDAKHLSTMVLPLLALLPKDILTQQFYEDFFNALFVGLEKKPVISSKSERQSWITSLSECLRYLSIQEADFTIEVTTAVHRTWTERILATDNDTQLRANLIKHSSAAMVSLVKYWLKLSKESNGDKYDQLVRNFWQNVGSTVLGQIEKLSTAHEEISNLIDGHILLLQTLKTAFLQDGKKKQSIKFDGDTNNTSDEKPGSSEVCDVSTVERYTHNLSELVEKTCSHYFEFADKKQVSSPVLTPLLTLIKEYDSQKLFVAVARHFSTNIGKELTVYGFYENVLRFWLSGDTMRCKTVVDVVFLMMKHMSNDEQDCMFATFNQFPPSVVESCISLCLCHPHSSAPSVRRWMGSALVETTLVSVCNRLIREGDCRARNLLLMSLSHDSNGEMIISNRTVDKILSLFSDALSDIKAPNLDHTASVASQILSSLATDGKQHEYRPLMLRLFSLNLILKRGDNKLSLDTWSEIQSSWQDGLSALSSNEKQAFTLEAVRLLQDKLLDMKSKLNINKIEHYASLCPNLISKLDDLEASENMNEIVSFTKTVLDIRPEAKQVPIEFYALRYDCIASNLQCPFNDDSELIKTVVEESSEVDTTELTKENLILYANRVLFRSLYLKALLVRQNSQDFEDEDENQVKESDNIWCNSLLRDDTIALEFMKLVYDYAIVKTLHEGYAFWPDHEIIRNTKARLDSLLNDVITATSLETRELILKSITKLAADNGYYWSYAARYYIEKCSLDHHTAEPSVPEFEQAFSGNGFYHTLQANAKSSTNPEYILKAKFLLMLRSYYLAHAEDKNVINEQFMQEVISCQADGSLDVIVNAYYRHNHTMLYEKDITSSEWRQVISNAAIVDYLAAMVDTRGWDAPSHYWDFTTITLCSIVNSIDKSKHHWGCSKVSLLARSVFNLYNSVESFITSVKERCLKQQPSDHVAHLPSEWADIFAPDLNANMFSILLHVLGSPTDTMTSPKSVFLSSLTKSTRHLNYDILPQPYRLGKYKLEDIVRLCNRSLEAPAHHGFKYLAYYTLTLIEKPLVLDDAERISLWSSQIEAEEQREKPALCLTYFKDTLLQLDALVDAALAGVKMCEETCEVVLFSDSHSIILGYLLLTQAVYRVCSLARGDLMHQYIEYFRGYKYADVLVSSALRLLPGEIVARAQENSNMTPAPEYVDLFTATPEFTLDEPATSASLSALACRCLQQCLSGMTSSSARSWYGSLTGKMSRVVQQVVRAYVTSPIVRDQLLRVQSKADSFEDAEITIHWSSHEVICVYTLDDRPIELTITLGKDHPLSLPQVTTSGGPAQNTQWITMYLAYQNGQIASAIKMWMDALSKKVEAAPSCYICYCRMHSSSGLLPKVVCHQCKNKYHTECLRKWFATSKKSNCPLCRANF